MVIQIFIVLVELTNEVPQFNALSPSDSSSNLGEMPDIAELMKKRFTYNRQRPINSSVSFFFVFLHWSLMKYFIVDIQIDFAV